MPKAKGIDIAHPTIMVISTYGMTKGQSLVS